MTDTPPFPTVEQLDRFFAGESLPDERRRIEAQLRDPVFRNRMTALRCVEIVPGIRPGAPPDSAAVDARWRQQLARHATERPTTPTRAPWPPTPRALRLMFSAGACAAVAATLWLSRSRDIGIDVIAPVAERRHTTGRGEHAVIQFSDGSRVTLGAESKLRYHAPFGEHDRTVTVEGEAYFDVAANARTPFVVHSGDAVVRVLGTTFAVRHYATDSAVQIVVANGKVAVGQTSTNARAVAPREVILAQGDLATLSRNHGTIVAHSVAVHHYTGWISGELAYRRARLADVMHDLERWYDIRIVFADPALAETTLSGAIDTKQSADHAIAELARTLNLTYAWRGQHTVTLSPK